MFKLSASILSADFAHLQQQARQALAAGADWLHVDVMDGHFVPAISMGPPVLKSLRPLRQETGALLDVHLMITEPDRYLEDFAEAGADIITVHVEAGRHLHRTIHHIKELGLKAGVTLNPATPLLMLEEILAEVDLALLMCVNPGFSGQSYIPNSTDRIGRLRQMLSAIDSPAWLSVDGGIKPENAPAAVAAGADVLVAASAIFNGPKTIIENVAELRRAVTNHRQEDGKS